MSNVAPLQQLMIEAIQDPKVSSEIVAELAEAVAADARYSSFLEKKERVDGERLLELLEDYENAVNACQRAWSQYVDGHSPGPAADVIKSLREIRNELRRQKAE